MKKEFLLLSILTSIALLVFLVFPDKQEESVESSADDHIDQVDEVVNEKNPVKDDNYISLTFDIVRITAQGDTVMAGKTSPNSNIQIFDGEEKLASVFSDPNGEWIWVSDFALKKGIKKFNLKHTDKFGIEHNSDQNIIVFLEGDASEQPIIVKYSDDGPGWAEILNKQNVVDGLALDLVDYSSDGKIIISGRSNPETQIKLYISGNFFGECISDKNGEWVFTSDYSNYGEVNLKVSTLIKNQEVILNVPIFKDKLKANVLNKEEKTFVVKPGNSLWRIARKTLGGGIFYTEIYKNNIKNIKNPDLIFPGQVFNIPVLKTNTFYE
tara:strand:+ start:154 stop:1128 length:975 start_codon:yes stop_codon:yes gene_type:complete